MRWLVLRSRSEQNRSLEKTVMANVETTEGKAAETVEARETTEEAATVVDSDGTTKGRAVETVEAAETTEEAVTAVDSDGTTEGKAVETTEEAATEEVVNPASPSATTIGRAETATTSISHSEPNAIGVEPLAKAGEVEEAARAVIETGHNVETTEGAPSHHEIDATIETPEAVDALETTTVGTEARRETETIGNGEATASERAVVTTDEVVDRTSEERPKETSVAQRENDRGTHTTAPRGISEPPVGLSEKTSEGT